MAERLEIIIQSLLEKTKEETRLNKQLKKLKLDPINLKVQIDETALKKQLSKIKVSINAAVKGASASAGGGGIAGKIFDVDKLEKEGRNYFASATKIVDRVKDHYKSMGSVDVTGIFKNSKNQIQGFTAEVTKATGEVEKFNYAKAKLSSTDWKSNQSGFVYQGSVGADKNIGANLESKLNTLNRMSNKLKDIQLQAYSLNKPITQAGNVDTLNKKYADIATAINNAKNSSTAMSKEQARNIGNMISDAERLRKTYQKTEYAANRLAPVSVGEMVEKTTANFTTLEKQWTKAGILVGDFKTKFDALKSSLPGLNSEGSIQHFNNRLGVLKETAKQLTMDVPIKSFRTFNAELEKSIASNRLQKYLLDNTKAAKKYSSEFDVLWSKLKNVTNPDEMKAWTKEFNNIKTTISAAGSEGLRPIETLMKSMKKFSTWLLASGGIMFAVRSLQKMVINVKEIDTAMVSLRKTTNLTDYEYNSFLERAVSNASELGSKVSDLIEATAEFSRTGFTVPESEELAKVATIYKNVADGMIDIGQASTVVISTLKAFNLTAQDSWKVIDILNEVGNRFSVGSNGLGESLRKSASALASANNTLEQSVGLITAMDEIIQDPDISGTALKTITMRLRNSAGKLQELGEDAEGAAESVTKLQQQIKSLSGVDIMINPTTFKSTYDIIVDLSKVWGDLSDKAHADLTRLIAGNYLVKRPRYVEIHIISTNLNPVMPKALLLQREMKQAA